MGVEMEVALALVLVFMGMDAQGFAQGPGADGEKHDANEALAPGGKEVHGQKVAQPEGEQADDGDAGGVADSPARARDPASHRLARGERRDGGEMIWP